MNNNWIKEFIEKLSSIEGRFDLYTSVFLKFENQFVLGLQDSKDWIEERGRKKAALSSFSGKIEEDADPIQFLNNYCLSELGVKIEVTDSSSSYIDFHHRLKRIPATFLTVKPRPQLITMIQKPGPSTKTNTLILGYLANTQVKPNLQKFSALIFAKEIALVQMFKNEKMVSELRKTGAQFQERIKIPDNLYLYPSVSLNSLLRFLSYEVF